MLHNIVIGMGRIKYRIIRVEFDGFQATGRIDSWFFVRRTLGDDLHVRGKRRYDEEQDRGTITNCIRNIVISMRFNNIGKVFCLSIFIEFLTMQSRRFLVELSSFYYCVLKI